MTVSDSSELKQHVLGVAQGQQVPPHGLVHRGGAAAADERPVSGWRQVLQDHLRRHKADAALPVGGRLVQDVVHIKPAGFSIS